MAWTVEYTDTAKGQLRKLDKQTARRIADYMDARVAGSNDPRSAGKALTGPRGGLWRYRVGNCRVICEIQDRILRVLVVRMPPHRQEERASSTSAYQTRPVWKRALFVGEAGIVQ